MDGKLLFAKSVNTQAYAKVGLLGFAGAGKTYTATRMAIGLVDLMRRTGLDAGLKPAFFLDTETGADWVEPMFREAGIELRTAKTRSFVDLLAAMDESERDASVLIVDSITHFWRELVDTYLKAKRRTRIEFQDWGVLKKEWGRFTDRYINSALHIIMCGRAGHEYDYFEDSDGKKQLEKTGIKMKAETETGYEASLLILMERHMDMDTRKVYRIANVLKDRSTKIDGKDFKNPTFQHFLPHFRALNLGGEQLGVDVSRASHELFDSDGDSEWRRETREKDIALDEIAELLAKHYPGQSAEAKKTRADLVEELASTRSWERVKALRPAAVTDLRNRLWLRLEGRDYAFAPALGRAALATDPFDVQLLTNRKGALDITADVA